MAEADVVGMQEVMKNTKAIADILGWHYLQQGWDTAVLSRFEIVGATGAKLGVKIRMDSGQEFHVFNTHLRHTPYQPYQLLKIPYNNAPFLSTEEEAVAASKSSRGDQVTFLIQEIDSIKHEATPVFITGDFNEPSHLDWTEAAAEAGIHPLKVAYPNTLALEKEGFRDAYRSVYRDEVEKPGHTWTPWTKPDDPRDHHDRIDFVLFRGQDVSVQGAKIVGEDLKYADIAVETYPSDHRAVVATFKIIKAKRRADKPD
jgi:endonuclease/exonuclease/phosphatase family metal-dependent hydrolase